MFVTLVRPSRLGTTTIPRNGLAAMMTIALACWTLVAPTAAGIFEEEFGGPGPSPTLWRTESAVEGNRWCDPNPGYARTPGSWVYTPVEACYGVTAPEPHGAIVYSAGIGYFTAPTGSRTFPWLVSGSDGASPFPSSGDFKLTVRLRFSRMAVCGSGVSILDWADTSPTGTNAPAPPAAFALQIWGDGGGLRVFDEWTGASRQIQIPGADPLAFHVYELIYVAGAYSLAVDGLAVAGPTPSNVRPTALYFGNPVVSYWMPCDWSHFEVDYVRIEHAGATEAHRSTWGSVKVHYR